MSILEVRGVTVKFGGLVALNGVSFHVQPSEILGVIGPNGSGKTTLFNAITGFVELTDGEILHKGERISNLLPYQVARRGIVRSYQKTSLFPNLTVAQNIAIGRHIRCNVNLWQSLCSTGAHKGEQSQKREKVQEVLEFLEMQSVRHTLACNLAYGFQRELGIGIALASEPALLLLDEPAAGLNSGETQELIRLIQVIRSRGVTILLVEHDMRMVMGISDRIVVLNYGVKIAEGKPDEISRNEEVIRVYLGEEVDYA